MSSLERQLEKYKNPGSMGGRDVEQRVQMLETMLEDATELKSKFEDDYLHMYQRNLALENEIKQLTADSGYFILASK